MLEAVVKVLAFAALFVFALHTCARITRIEHMQYEADPGG